MFTFYADNHNARFTWSWVDGKYSTDDPVLIEHYKGIGLRFEEAKVEPKPAKKPAAKKAK